MLTASLAFTGCSALAPPAIRAENPTENPAENPVGGPLASAAASANQAAKPTTPAQAYAAKLTTALTALGKQVAAPSRDQLRSAFAGAGADANTVEVSIDKTPTGLAVDAVEGAAVVDRVCVIGQVRAGAVHVTTLPVLDSGRCFVGDQR